MATLADETRTFVSDHWQVDMTLREWWTALAAASLSFPEWSSLYGGRDASSTDARMARAVFDTLGVIGPPGGVGAHLAAPTLLKHGSGELCARLLPSIADGTAGWCQLFSEPEAGSDLAGLRSRALLDGDEWIVDGQKVWNSNAHSADFGLLIARTDAEVPKHLGLSFFVLPMAQPGVEVRPLRQMNGDAEFDEVFLTGARLPADHLVDQLGRGWAVANTTLAFERGNIASRGGGISLIGGHQQGHLDRTIASLLDSMRATQKRPISGYMIGNRQMIELAREAGRATDPVIRQRLAGYRTLVDVNRWTVQRAAANAKRGTPGAESSVSKLAVARLARVSRELSLEILGADGMLSGADAPHEGAVQHVALTSPGASLGGGTDEIQRNVVAERALGLPKEPANDRDVPFSGLPLRGDRR